LTTPQKATVARHPLYAAFVEYAEKRGAHRSVYEWTR